MEGIDLLQHIRGLMEVRDAEKKIEAVKRKEGSDKFQKLSKQINEIEAASVSEQTKKLQREWSDACDLPKDSAGREERKKATWDVFSKSADSDKAVLNTLPKYVELKAEYKKISDENFEFALAVKNKNELVDEKIKEAMKVPKEDKGTLIPRKVGPLVNKSLDRSVDTFNDLVSSKVTSKISGVSFDILKEGRSYYSYYSNSDKTVHIGKDKKTKDIVHELGHAIEHSYPTAHREIHAYLDRVTKGSTTKPLGATYDKDEVYKERTDGKKWVHKYFGKIYKNGSSTELLSMGLEYYATNPSELIKKDPELFVLIADIVRGNL
jgi:hypothetical protein